MNSSAETQNNKEEAEQKRIAAEQLLYRGRISAAITLLQQAISIDPQNANAALALGKALIVRNSPREGIKQLEKALTLGADPAEAYLNLGHANIRIHDLEKAKASYQSALDIATDMVPALIGMGATLNQMGLANESLPFLERATKANQYNPQAWSKYIAILEFTGNLNLAAEKIAEARSLLDRPEYGIDLTEAKIAMRQKDYALAADLLEKIFTSHGTGTETATARYQLGKAYDHLGRYKEAFRQFEMANRLIGQMPFAKNINRDVVPQRIKNTIDIFTKEFASAWPETSPKTAPVFLVGFPRSGTTLLDQILSSHPAITVAEEKPVIVELRQSIEGTYPQNLADLGEDNLNKLHDKYYALHGVAPDDGKVFIDKMPLNILDIGFIYRLFPDSKIILALRHPLDSVFSCFMQEFTLNPAMVQFLELESSAEFYDMTFTLLEKYQDALPLNIHTVRYEDVVANFEDTIKSLIGFLDIEWDDAVLDYDKTAKTKQSINTPSYHQVTQKIYDSARYRHINYGKQLEPVNNTLGPWVDKFGYKIETKE